ncbi:putative NADH-flavin reductase [Isoptericola sp. CG 20/1183]|uniref:NADH-flavin reductase n=1 Tax=Isoptericola halotolerans TaxID=300560 RepID=A0ABX5EHF3_9MICO|nr:MULTISPECIES: NAD(P)H-binding protein [Isoptericola]PRZ08857.1 putative NADH-flavin reductase [Isoptericola halotolerans]PRZ10696.1 putative NADH-flavin reductase [Isoptericola sp. CG 20/1183]
MKIALVGATGRTGRHALTTALEHGHDVSVLVRRPDRLPAEVRGQVRVVVGDSTDPAALGELVRGAEAVVSALGPTAKEADLHTRTARALVDVMAAHGPRRFVGVSGAGIDVPGDRKAGKDKVISWLIRTLGGDVVKDKPAEHAVWSASGLDWTLVRPPRLVDGEATGRLEHDAHRSTRSTTIRRADLGAFLVDVAEGDRYARQAPFVATAR